MNLFDIFLTSIYLHFFEMREKGRQVIPWFQTAVAIALFGSISVSMIFKIMIGDRFSVGEAFFIVCFLLSGLLIFYSVKKYFFDTGKHIYLAGVYMKIYSKHQKLVYKSGAIAFLLLIPIVLGFVIWYKATPL